MLLVGTEHVKTQFMLVNTSINHTKHKSHVSEHALSQYNHPVTYISFYNVNITDSATAK